MTGIRHSWQYLSIMVWYLWMLVFRCTTVFLIRPFTLETSTKLNETCLDNESISCNSWLTVMLAGISCPFKDSSNLIDLSFNTLNKSANSNFRSKIPGTLLCAMQSWYKSGCVDLAIVKSMTCDRCSLPCPKQTSN